MQWIRISKLTFLFIVGIVLALAWPATPVSFVVNLAGAAILLYVFIVTSRYRKELERTVDEKRQAEKRLKARTRELELLREVAAASNGAVSLEEALKTCLDAMCRYLDWPLAQAWIVPPEASGPGNSGWIVPAGIFHSGDPYRFEELRPMLEGVCFRAGEGLPGRVMQNRRAEWIEDFASSNLRRLDIASRTDLKTALAFPVIEGSDVVAVLEFFSQDHVLPKAEILPLAEHLGIELGRVVERKRLGEWQARLASVVEVSQDAVVGVDALGYVNIWNPAAERLFGYHPSEILGKPVTLLHGDAEAGRERNRRILVEGQTIIREEGTRRHKDGSLIEVSATITPLKDRTGKIIGAAAIMHDIRRRKAAVRALEKSRALLADSQTIARLGSFDLNTADNSVEWSEEMYRLFGVSSETFKPAYESFMSLVHPEDRERVAGKVRRVLETGEDYRNEYRVIRRDGSLRWVAARGRVQLGPEPGGKHLVGCVQDVTEAREREQQIKESEERFRFLFMANPLPMWVFDDTTLRFVEVNEAAVRYYGYSREEFFAMSVTELRPAEDTARFLEYLKTLPESGALDGGEWRHKTKDGRVLSVLVTGYHFQFKGRGSYLVVSRDITALKEAEATLRLQSVMLRETAEELKRSNQDLESFAYVASHDLQEPLRMVSCYLSLLGERYGARLPADAKEFLGFAREGSIRMKEMISDLLSYARIGSEGKKLALTDMKAEVSRVLSVLRLALEESGADVRLGNLPSVIADRGQIRQLFQNLIGNAIKFRGKDPLIVTIDAQEREDDWVFRVMDNGIGMQMENVQRIFVLFQRLNPRHEYGGSGIGLAVCKKIVELHGGHIWVESQPGKGSTFYFTLPNGNSERRRKLPKDLGEENVMTPSILDRSGESSAFRSLREAAK